MITALRATRKLGISCKHQPSLAGTLTLVRLVRMLIPEVVVNLPYGAGKKQLCTATMIRYTQALYSR